MRSCHIKHIHLLQTIALIRARVPEPATGAHSFDTPLHTPKCMIILTIKNLAVNDGLKRFQTPIIRLLAHPWPQLQEPSP